MRMQASLLLRQSSAVDAETDEDDDDGDDDDEDDAENCSLSAHKTIRDRWFKSYSV